jgi:aryl-alcohol dehydrogenase-like predicted oxidoreductase
MRTRSIPSTGEALPVVGLGTYKGFDVGEDAADRARLGAVVAALFSAGGTIIDSSPMYGRAEAVSGRLLNEGGWRDRAFVMTKVWTQGRAAGERQMRASLAHFGRAAVDLMQIHNLVDWRTHLKTLRGWKERGLVRYVGLTHYTPAAFAELAAIVRAEPVDFLQFPYSIAERAAEAELLPLCAERGVATVANYPLASGALPKRLAGRAVPDFARARGIESWAAFCLAYALGHPAMTCVIPGTGNPAHAAEAFAAGALPPPDAATRRRMAEYVADL